MDNNLLTLKIKFVDLNNELLTIKVKSSMIVYDVLKHIKDKYPDKIKLNEAQNYGLFIPKNDLTECVWLENGRSLDFYMIRNEDIIEYRNKYRQIQVKLLDGELHKLMIDDGETVSQLMITICSALGIANYEEYSLINEATIYDKDNKTSTLKKDKTIQRDYKKMEELKKKLHTDDDTAWLDHSKTLRQQGIDENATLILKRKYFFSDKNIDTKDPVQLKLLYIQCRDAILNGTHPVKEEEAIKFAALQCQIEYGDYNETKQRSGLLENLIICYKAKCTHSYPIVVINKANSVNNMTTTTTTTTATTTATATTVTSANNAIVTNENKTITNNNNNSENSDTQKRTKFFCLKKFLPKEYIKVKGIEKKIFAEHKTIIGLSELDAYYKYTQLCRSLKTYGVTFFLVKEKVKGKNKLIARLLGITKESIVKMDEKTKDIINKYPLERVKKWAASPNTFTLDFGDHYNESLYTVQTTEGENIARLIAGYIDIIMKKKKDKEFADIDVDEESPMVEEIISPSKATVMQINRTNMSQVTSGSVGLPGILRNGQEGNSFTTGNFMQQGSMTRQAHIGYSNNSVDVQDSVHASIRPQRPLLTTIDVARNVIDIAQNNLQQRATIGEVGSDPASLQWKENLLDVNKQNVTSHLSAMNAATAQVVTLTSDGPTNTDYNAVGAAVSSISTNLGDFSKDIMIIAALQDSSNVKNDRLMDAAKRLCGAFSEFLKVVEADSDEPRQNLFSAASKIGEATSDVMRNIHDADTKSQKIQESLIGLSKCVASSTAGLVIAAKNVANHCEDQQGVNQVISLVTQCALSTSQLISCTKLCATTISNRECQEQLIEAARFVSRNVDAVVDATLAFCANQEASDNLQVCANNVNDTILQLMESIKASNEDNYETKQDESIDKILNVTDHLFNCVGDAPEMIKQAKILAQATTELVNSLRQEALTQSTSDQQRKLLQAAKLLAEATSKMVEAAKGCATNPKDENMQTLLCKAAEDLRSATTIAAGDNLQNKLIKKLQVSAKQAASCATQTIAAVQVCTLHHDQSNNNNQAQVHLIEQCKIVADNVPRIVQGIRGCMVQPESKSAHLCLINACEDFLIPTQKMIALCKSVLPTISDEIKSIQMRNCTKQLATALSDLRSCLSRAQEMCGSFEAATMIEAIKGFDEELMQIHYSASSAVLKPFPGETLETCENQLGAVTKALGLSMAQMLTASAQKNEIYTGIAAKDTINSLRILKNAIRGIMACSPGNHGYHNELISTSHGVLQRAVELMQEAELTLLNQNESNQHLAQLARNISQSLYDCVNCLPGQKEIDQSIKHLSESSKALSHNEYPQTNKAYTQIQSELNHSAVNLNQLTNEIVIDARKGENVAHQLAQSTNRFSNSFDYFMSSGLALAGKTDNNNELKANIVSSLRDVYANSSKLLQGAKSVAADPHAPNMKNQLALAAKNLTESINSVISLCLENNAVSNAQKQCDNALRDLETIRTLVADECTNEAVKELSYYDCSDQIFEQSRGLGESLTGLKRSTEQSDVDAFVKYTKDVSQSICGLVEAAAQSSYLIGVSDVSSRRGKIGILDASQFISASKIIHETCNSLVSVTPTIDQQQQQKMIQSATLIAHVAAALCNASRTASTKTTNSLAKRHFVQSAKQVANSTALLVKSIKSLDGNPFTQEHYNNLARPLIESVENLCQFALSPEFQSVPAIISDNGKKAQEPILSATRGMLDASCVLINASKSLIANSKDPQQWQKFATNSKLISDSIKRLVTSIKEKAPAKIECDKTLDILEACMKFVDNASIAALNQSLVPPSNNQKPLQVYQEQAIICAAQITQLIGELKNAAKFEAEKLGHTVTEISNYFEPLVLNVIGCASKTVNSQQQIAFLEQTKTVLESASQLLIASKEGAGNSKNLNCHQAIDENAEGTREVLEDLIQTLEEATAQNGNVSSMVDNLSKAIARIDDNSYDQYQETEDSQATKYGAGDASNGGSSFVEHHTKIVQLSKAVQQNAQDMSLCQITELGRLASQLTQTFNTLTTSIKGAITTCSNRELENRLKSKTQELGKSCIDLVHSAGQYQNKSNDKMLKKELISNIDEVNRKTSQLLLTFESNSKGTQACINASSAVNGIIADLDTVILFATSGTLNSELESDLFNNHRESILKTAKSLVEDTKTLVTSAATSQDQLASAAQSAVKTITKLTEAVKLGAAALGSKQPDAQVLLINAVKDVASALNELIIATKLAASKNQDAEMENLKDSAKNMVTNVQSLLKTVKTVEDEAARGTRAIESSVEAISQELKSYSQILSTNFVELDQTQVVPATSEDLMRAAKQLTLATSKTVSAGTTSKQEEMIVAANMGRKAVSDLLTVCRGVAIKIENKEINPEIVLNVGYNSAVCYKELLEFIQTKTVDKQRLVQLSKQVANSVSDIVQVAEKIKGGDLVDPEDPTVIAEHELFGAANAIEAAALKLAQLKPRPNNKAVNENLNFDEQIIEAAKSITNAAVALIKAATTAQKELISQGKMELNYQNFNDEGQWSQGLISAARVVAAACHTLCEAANGLVQGHCTEERLVASAKQVASSTAALLVACKVKSGVSSQAMKRLQNAGNAVKRATDALVRSAQQAVEANEEEKSLQLGTKFVDSMAQEIRLREEMFTKEREFKAAQDKYLELKKLRYQREASPSSNNDNSLNSSANVSYTSTTIVTTSYSNNNNNSNQAKNNNANN